MKKVILITSIVWAAICLAIAIIEITYGAGQLTPLSSESVDWQPATELGIANICIGSYFALGLLLTLVLILKTYSNMSKRAGLVLGIVSAVLGAIAPGILFAIDSNNNRQ